MDTNELSLFVMLHLLDDYTLSKACQVNKKFYKKLCQVEWIKRIVNRFGLTRNQIDKYKYMKSYQQYYYYLDELFDTEMHIDYLLPAAMKNNRVEMVIATLHMGANIRLPYITESLKIAEQKGYHEIVRLLSEAKANIL